MTWIQPIFFLGLIGLIVPIFIHLWNGRKGKIIYRAATAWLNPQESQSSRSVKLDNLLLLIVRILFLVILVLFFVGLWLENLETENSPKVVHLISPERQVEAEFRFELEQALERGDEVYWINNGLEEYDLGSSPNESLSDSWLKKALEDLPFDVDSVHIYLSQKTSLLENKFWGPKIPILHWAQASSEKDYPIIIQIEGNQFLEISENGILKLPAGDYPKARNWPEITYHFEDVGENQKSSFLAAFEALKEVHGFSFQEKEEAELIFTNRPPNNPKPDVLYFVNGNFPSSKFNAASFEFDKVSNPLEWVIDKGALPEVILSKYLEFKKVIPDSYRLSNSQIQAKFVQIPDSKASLVPNSSEMLLILAVILFGLERHLSFRENL